MNAETDVVRVLVADDHTVVRAGVRALLRRDAGLEVIGEAATRAEAERLLAARRPRVLLLDLHMPGGGVGAVGALRAAFPDVAIVVLTMADDVRVARAVLQAGAEGYVLKDAPEAELPTAVRVVAEGSRYVDPRLGVRLLEDAGEDPDGLTPRERDVLRLIARGHTNRDVARSLYLSVRTVEAQRAQLQRKLGLHTRPELVTYALRRGLLADA